jgi:light-regulated signal transduction histidine kinase (bacteriophytochrome)
VTLPDTLPHVHYDATELGMVFRNLIVNGIKFNSAESPHISIAVQEHPREYIVAVGDNGIGLLPEDQERIFSIFERLHSAGKYAGTGAGLTIVKKIVESHGGRIWVTSDPTVGSTFTFSIPRHE